MTGARLVLARTEAGTSEAELEAAIGPSTAALFVPAHLDGAGHTIPLARVVANARRHGLKVLVDAAYMCWPLEAMPGYVAAGADLVCFSAKYFGGPNAGGFMVGTRAMIDAVTANNFTRYESGPHLTIGRVFKTDRQTVVGVVTAFEEWRAADHPARWPRYARLAEQLRARLAGLSGVTAGRATLLWTREGSPSIAADVQAERLIFCFDAISDDEVGTVGTRLLELLSASV